MAWQIGPKEHRSFPRNPLTTVVAELKFYPVLKIPSRVEDFQDLIRDDFPVYEESEVKNLSFNPQTEQVLSKADRTFLFKDTASTWVTLATESLAIETTAYTDHKRFLGAFGQALESLLTVFPKIRTKRLGLRYINLLDRAQISGELGTDVDWDSLVGEVLLKAVGPADLAGATYNAQVSSPIHPGTMTLRHGLFGPQSERPKYRIDIDRYLEREFEVEETADLLNRFSDDCFALFSECAGKLLVQWMEGTGDEKGVADA